MVGIILEMSKGSFGLHYCYSCSFNRALAKKIIGVFGDRHRNSTHENGSYQRELDPKLITIHPMYETDKGK